MAVLETIINVLLALAAVAFVGYPFLRPVKEEAALRLAPEEEQLLERKGAVEGALREVEFDFRTGKLAEKDYQALMSRYRREQTEVLSMLGESPVAPAPEKAAVPDELDVALDGGVRRAEPPADVCRACGSAHPAGAKFCGSCGSTLGSPGEVSRKGPRTGVGRCGECGAQLRPGNKFCGSCGAKAPARS